MASHTGNIAFRETIEHQLERYHSATSKLDKSLIVIEIVDEIRSRTMNGGFIQQKKDPSDRNTKIWFEIGDTLARAKVGHALRDAVRSHGNNNTVVTTSVISRTTITFCQDIMPSETGSPLLCDEARNCTKNGRERMRQHYDLSELLRISLISISDTGTSAIDVDPSFGDEDDNEFSQESFDFYDTIESFHPLGVEAPIFVEATI